MGVTTRKNSRVKIILDEIVPKRFEKPNHIKVKGLKIEGTDIANTRQTIARGSIARFLRNQAVKSSISTRARPASLFRVFVGVSAIESFILFYQSGVKPLSL